MAVVKRCRWCLDEFECVTPRQIARQVFCCPEHNHRHSSRRRYAPDDADGYGAKLRSPVCCQCSRPVPARDVAQGRNSKVLCDGCRLPAAKDCPRCGRRHRGENPACSDVCSAALRREHFARKSKRRRDRVASSPEQFTRREILERDGWVCQICGEPTDRSAEHPDPLAPVVDHIVPIAAGGAHVRRNVQCAHSVCNTRKGASLPAAVG